MNDGLLFTFDVYGEPVLDVKIRVIDLDVLSRLF